MVQVCQVKKAPFNIIMHIGIHSTPSQSIIKNIKCKGTNSLYEGRDIKLVFVQCIVDGRFIYIWYKIWLQIRSQLNPSVEPEVKYTVRLGIHWDFNVALLKSPCSINATIVSNRDKWLSSPPHAAFLLQLPMHKIYCFVAVKVRILVL